MQGRREGGAGEEGRGCRGGGKGVQGRREGGAGEEGRGCRGGGVG